ncbi:MAG TPA: hypothetical protein VNL18_03930 [Gemmatimonadales bacterium]|nr:hypothetical protein [Gemmatimonadales bacterium]
MNRFLIAIIVAGCALAGGADLNAQEELFNFGRQWNGWSSSFRSIYLDGFIDGQSSTYFALEGDLPSERREALRQKTFTFYGVDAIRDVMTDLYADPANAFIRYDAMVYIARAKLDGKDVEPMLRYSRENDRRSRKP